jgi:hypothetical protein
LFPPLRRSRFGRLGAPTLPGSFFPSAGHRVARRALCNTQTNVAKKSRLRFLVVARSEGAYFKDEKPDDYSIITSQLLCSF